ncbi:MAG TPA: hypothetical protein VGA70_13470 [Longimicrobiales bacterium]|jgi:hypothetical protein
MVYLCEREIGFDGTAIGFPSVLGCRAIVVVTGGGLFGFHLNGTLSTAKRNAFVGFITTHAHGNVRRAVYAASTGVGFKADHDELRAIAQDLGYTGAIYWGSLSTAGSVYVHYQDVNHTTCTLTSRAWDDATDSVDGNKTPYVAGPNRAIANGAAPTRMYNNVSTVGLKAVYPTKI